MSGGIGAIRQCRGVKGALGAGRECRCSGASIGIGGIRGHWGLLGSEWGVRVCWRAVGGVRSALGWQVDWEPDHIGPQSRVHALPLVPLGE